jgi:hypothetical protein
LQRPINGLQHSPEPAARSHERGSQRQSGVRGAGVCCSSVGNDSSGGMTPQRFERRRETTDLQELIKLVVVHRPSDPLSFLSERVLSLRDGESVSLPRESGSCGTEDEANEYLATHRVPQVLEELFGKLLFEKPDDPHAFLSSQLSLLARGATDSARKDGFFKDEDLRGMFSLFDPTRRGSISPEQACAGVAALGMKDAEPPSGSSVSEEEFVAWARKLLDASRII